MNETTLELQATPEEVMRGVEHLERFCAGLGVSSKAIHALMLAVEEMASNVVNHAYARDATRTFRLTLRHDGDRVVAELRDRGPAFDPLRAAAPDFETDTESREIGGLGIHLVRRTMDDLRYTREGDENVLCMTKILTPV